MVVSARSGVDAVPWGGSVESGSVIQFGLSASVVYGWGFLSLAALSPTLCLRLSCALLALLVIAFFPTSNCAERTLTADQCCARTSCLPAPSTTPPPPVVSRRIHPLCLGLFCFSSRLLRSSSTQQRIHARTHHVDQTKPPPNQTTTKPNHHLLSKQATKHDYNHQVIKTQTTTQPVTAAMPTPPPQHPQQSSSSSPLSSLPTTSPSPPSSPSPLPRLRNYIGTHISSRNRRYSAGYLTLFRRRTRRMARSGGGSGGGGPVFEWNGGGGLGIEMDMECEGDVVVLDGSDEEEEEDDESDEEMESADEDEDEVGEEEESKQKEKEEDVGYEGCDEDDDEPKVESPATLDAWPRHIGRTRDARWLEEQRRLRLKWQRWMETMPRAADVLAAAALNKDRMDVDNDDNDDNDENADAAQDQHPQHHASTSLVDSGLGLSLPLPVPQQAYMHQQTNDSTPPPPYRLHAYSAPALNTQVAPSSGVGASLYSCPAKKRRREEVDDAGEAGLATKKKRVDMGG
ncbi:uncharacterized protein J3D65DRAFT_200280 [Phyllosticta citribraziliensis]|uniref:Uncharacterized protein n=1 Tax=Phyllosticta citribraziliensis TaxID=989973 RepID=A0ABR1M3C0_9PEZI